MNLPSLVHHSQHQSHFSQPMLGHGHLHDQSILGSQQNHHYHHHHRHHSSSYPQHSNEYLTYPPAPPPSPPVEDNSKCSLPSISTLLVYADGGQTNGSGIDRPHNNQAPTQHYHGQQSQPQRMNLPPTPPMRPESGFEVNNSPTMSSQSPSSGYYYSQSSIHSHRNSYPPSTKPLYASSPTESHYSSQSTYYSPSQSGMVYNKHMSPHQSHQLLIPVTVAPPSTSNPWHHHHHSAPASHAPFPQSQDRYICQTCNKAFSRPSSLRIHSHSHTGEKPYKCPHHGCGKAFSVRSNMKRHERGCHQ